MADNPNRPENGERPPKPPDSAGTGRRAEMTREAVAMVKAKNWENEVAKLKGTESGEKPKPTDNKKADPGPMERTMDRKYPDLGR